MSSRPSIIPCSLSYDSKKLIETYAMELRESAPDIGSHGLDVNEFWNSGIFHSAIERLRGQQAASMETKRSFVAAILNYLLCKKSITHWEFKGSAERYDYEVLLPDGRIAAIETKGCLDGNNTNIFQRPLNADEFFIWSLCQNAGADPKHNAWSGIHTRLSAEIIAKREAVDAVIIWDMLCGTIGRPCPKIASSINLSVDVGSYHVPPPCVYLLPRTVPDPRNNPKPPVWQVNQLGFIKSLFDSFKCSDKDIVSVSIEVRMSNADIERQTKYTRAGTKETESNWTVIRRSR